MTTTTTAPPDDIDSDFEDDDELAGLDGELSADERSRREMGRTCRLVHSACSKWIKARGLSEPMYQRRRHSEAVTGERRDPTGIVEAGEG